MAVRRRYLEPHPVGRRLVAWYETVGPILAQRLEAHPRLKGMVRGMVEPFAQACHLFLETRAEPFDPAQGLVRSDSRRTEAHEPRKGRAGFAR